MPVISREFATRATVFLETDVPWSRFRESRSTSRPVSLNTASVSFFAPIGIVTSSLGAGMPAPILLIIERPLLIPCPAHRSRRAPAPTRVLIITRYVSNSGYTGIHCSTPGIWCQRSTEYLPIGGQTGQGACYAILPRFGLVEVICDSYIYVETFEGHVVCLRMQL